MPKHIFSCTSGVVQDLESPLGFLLKIEVSNYVIFTYGQIKCHSSLPHVIQPTSYMPASFNSIQAIILITTNRFVFDHNQAYSLHGVCMHSSFTGTCKLWAFSGKIRTLTQAPHAHTLPAHALIFLWNSMKVYSFVILFDNIHHHII